MEADGTVERLDYSEDRRVTLVRLTEKGEAILRTLRPGHRIFLSYMMSCYNDEELSQFTHLLEKLKGQLEQVSASAG